MSNVPKTKKVKLQNKLIRMLFLTSVLPLLIIAIITILGVLSIWLFVVVVLTILMAMTLQLKTAKQQLEELESVHKELLECERMAVMGRMASVLSHELRNVFAGIQTSTYYLKDKVLRDHPQLANSFQDIEKEVNYTSNIINNILSFTRPRKIQPTDININLIIEDAISALNRQGIFEDMEIVRDLDSRLPKVSGDATQIKEVILNLVINAVQAMPNGGKLTLVTKKEESLLRLKVIDTGSGIPQDALEKLFTPFFTTKNRGLGLGLSICKEIINAHGGRIEVETELNKGTKFIVRLPY